MGSNKLKFIKKSKDFYSAEAYKSLRTNLIFCGSDVKVIALTSCLPNDGKSTVALDLSLSLAEDNKRVLLIDADLRKSLLISRVEVSKSSHGLSHYLSGQNGIQDIVFHGEDSNLDIILTGSFPPNPAELLGSEKFAKLIEDMRPKYDYIIIDTPPIGSVIDSAIIAKSCDGIAMVIRPNKISYKFAAHAIDQLQKTNCKILGVIFNGVELKENSSYYYSKYYGKYYGEYYGKYTSDEGEKEE